MKRVRRRTAGLLVLALGAVLALGFAAWQAKATTSSGGVPPVVGTAVPGPISTSGAAAILPSPTPTPRPAPPPPTMRTTDPDVTAGAPPGVPAIKPHLTPGPNLPTFTADDVRAAIAAQGVSGIRMRATDPFQIESIVFVTGAEAKSRYGVYLSSDDRLLCLVTIHGTWVADRPAPPGAISVQTDTLHTVVIAYDARTGNYLGQQGQP